MLLCLFSTTALSNQAYVDENGLFLGSTRTGFDRKNGERASTYSELLLKTGSLREAKEVLVRDILLADFGVDDSSDEVTVREFAAHAVARAKFGDGRESIAIVAPIGCLEEEVKGGGGKGGDDRIKEEEADAVALALEVFFYVQVAKGEMVGTGRGVGRTDVL